MAENELTAGAKWAIERLDELAAQSEYEPFAADAIRLVGGLRAGRPIALALAVDGTLFREFVAILQAALSADAQAAVNRDVSARAGARFAELWTAIRELDGRTLGSRKIGGGR